MFSLLTADVKALEAFHTKCRRQMLCVRWQDHVGLRNDEVVTRSYCTFSLQRAFRIAGRRDGVTPTSADTWRGCHPLSKPWTSNESRGPFPSTL